MVQAPTVGAAPWSIAVDDNVGAAGVYGPPDRGFPDDGVIALGAYCEPGWVIADLDLDAIARVRGDGQVLGHRDWDLPGHLAAPAVRLQRSPEARHHAPGDGQSKRGLAGDAGEWIEEAGEVLLVHPFTGVLDGDDDATSIFPRLHPAGSGRPRSSFFS